MRVQAPNGLVFDLPESVATGLLASAGSGFTPAPAPPPPEVEARPKPRARRRRKTSGEVTE